MHCSLGHEIVSSRSGLAVLDRMMSLKVGSMSREIQAAVPTPNVERPDTCARLSGAHSQLTRTRNPLPPTDELGQIIESLVRKCVADLSHNSLPECDGIPIWDTPEAGFADGRAPLFMRYKSVIGAFHLMPEEALAATEVDESRIRNRGLAAACPPLSPQRDCVDAPSVGLASIWSERHIAYAAGLGTFGHHRAFISRRGSAIRLGSVVTNASITLTPRAFSSHLENCLLAKGKKCLACASRCPAGAISEKGHDKRACRDYYYRHIVPTRSDSGVPRMGCGLCTTGVPCESRIPH